MTTPKASKIALIQTGIRGLDDILSGGLPQNRSMLILGPPGSGKSLLGLEFILKGISDYQQPGALFSFEETPDDIIQNARGFSWRVDEFLEQDQIHIGHIDVSQNVGVQTGAINLEGLFLRLEMGIKKVGAKRVVLDGISNLLASFDDEKAIRKELLNLFKWFKEQGITVLITAENATDKSAHEYGRYLADGVLVLDNRIENKVAKRFLRVVKCRGVDHVTDEYPFRITKDGLTINPVISVGLDYPVIDERISSGIPALDDMLDGEGIYRGSSVLILGSAGTGKSSVAAAFLHAACQRGERAVYFSFEESESQICRNMRSIGINLNQHVEQDKLLFHNFHAINLGLEGLLDTIQHTVATFKPSIVAIDPISAIGQQGEKVEIRCLLIRILSLLRHQGITIVMTNLAAGGVLGEKADMALSSLADTSIQVRIMEHNAERNNVIQVLKARGMNHSNKLAEFEFTPNGIQLIEPFIGLNGVSLGSARIASQAKAKQEVLEKQHELEEKKRALEAKRKLLDARISALEAEYEVDQQRLSTKESLMDQTVKIRAEMATKVKAERES